MAVPFYNALLSLAVQTRSTVGVSSSIDKIPRNLRAMGSDIEDC